MSLLIAFFAHPWVCPSVLIALIQTTVNHGLLMHIHGRLLGDRIPLRKLLLCAFGASALHLIPLYLADALLFPGLLTSSWMYSLLMFVNPLSAVAYYYVVKGVLRLSPTKTGIYIRNMLLTHYAATLAYLLQINLLHGLIPMSEMAQQFHLHKILSSLLVIAELTACIGAVSLYLRRTQRSISIPPSFADRHVAVSFMKSYAVLTLFFAGATLSERLWPPSGLESFDPAISLVYLLLIACGLIYFFYSMSKLRERLLDWEMRETETYIRSLQNANQEFREIKHDFYNVLQTYSGFLELGDYDGLRRYHEELFQTTRHAGEFLSLVDVLKNRVVVYSLLKCKAEMAEKAGVKFSINRVCDIASVMLSDIDLSRVMNIVLDNAIEAARQAQEKQVSVSIEHKDPETFLFAISNTTAEDVDVARIFENGYTTKSGHTGIGLAQVAHILDGYDHCKSRVKYQENRFTLFLTLAAQRSGYGETNIA